MSKILHIDPATSDDIRIHDWEDREGILSRITKHEIRPGYFSWRKSESDPETIGGAWILTGITFVLALIVSIPVGMLLTNDFGSGWLWLYAICAPTGILAILFWLLVIHNARYSYKSWLSRRRYAHSLGWLDEYLSEANSNG